MKVRLIALAMLVLGLVAGVSAAPVQLAPAHQASGGASSNNGGPGGCCV